MQRRPSPSFPQMLMAVVHFSAAAVSMSILFPVTCIAMLLSWNTDAMMWIAGRFWAPLMMRLVGVRLEVQGTEHVSPRVPTVYASNHRSTIDIPVLMAAIPTTSLRAVAKDQLKWVPVLGWYMWLAR